MENFITQYPTPPNEWLYKDENENRLFSDYVIRPTDSEPWNECTNADKEEWEKSHPQPQPEEPM